MGKIKLMGGSLLKRLGKGMAKKKREEKRRKEKGRSVAWGGGEGKESFGKKEFT